MSKPARSRASEHRRSGLVGDVFRLAAAVAILVAVVGVTRHAVTSANSTAEGARLQDRVDLAKAFAGTLEDWLGAARAAAANYASGSKPAELAGWDTLRVAPNGTFTGTSGRYVAQAGPAQSHPCTKGAGLGDLVAAANQAHGAVALVVHPPGTCTDPVIGAAAPAAGGTAVVTTDIGPFVNQIAVASRLTSASQKTSGVRTFVVDPAGTLLVPGQPPDAAPAYLTAVASRLGSAAATSARTSNDAHTKVVDAGARIESGWTVVVEQDAETFDVHSPILSPSRTVIAAVLVLFGLLLFLQALADARRRTAIRYADAHTAAFLTVLGHELRTPLTVIKGFIDTLTSRWGSLSDAQRHDLVDRLPQQNRRLNRVVERLLLAANLQAGSAPRPTISTVNIAQALERVADDFRPMAPLHEFVVVAPRDVMARADSRTLDQVLDQLVDNAVRYSPSGGLVRLGVVRRRGHVEISVEDEGIGLPKDTRSLFQAFAQGENTDMRVHDEGGVGVGLYIVRRLCEQLGGSVRAERVPRGGARFVVTLRPGRVREKAAV